MTSLAQFPVRALGPPASWPKVATRLLLKGSRDTSQLSCSGGQGGDRTNPDRAHDCHLGLLMSEVVVPSTQPPERWRWWFSLQVVSDSCDPMDCSPPGSSVHGVSQARILEWVAIPLSRGSSQPGDQTWVSCIAGRFFTI